jgi:hypothetical protein
MRPINEPSSIQHTLLQRRGTTTLSSRTVPSGATILRILSFLESSPPPAIS